MPKVDTYNICPPGVEFLFWQLEETPGELASAIEGGEVLLDEAKSKFKSVERQREWLATRALLQQSGYSHAVMYRTSGAPYLDGCDKYISISHTKGLVVVAVSEYPVGIDIEPGTRNAMGVAGMLVQEKDVVGLDNGEALRLWTAKEAAYKLFPDKAVTIKDITLCKTAESASCTTYNATYPCGTAARCSTYETGGYILSCCL